MQDKHGIISNIRDHKQTFSFGHTRWISRVIMQRLPIDTTCISSPARTMEKHD